MTPKMTVWVHVGLPKCGSTSVQRYFSANEAVFLKQGLCYPRTGRSTGGYQSHEPIARAKPAELAGLVEAIEQEAAGCRQILISCEDFANALPLGNGPALVSLLNERFGAGQVRILSYFRNLFDFVESCYAQFILGGLFKIDTETFFHGPSPDLDGFLAAFEQGKGFPLYSALGHASQMARHYPENRIFLKSIERADIGAGGLVGDICSTMGLVPGTEVSAQNKRATHLMLAAAHHARQIVPLGVYKRMRPELGKLLRRPRWVERAKTFDCPDLAIGAALHDRIKARVEAEQAELGALFSSDVAGLCEDRWVHPAGRDALTAQEKARIGDLFVRAAEAEAMRKG